jgi:hypothetical protein
LEFDKTLNIKYESEVDFVISDVTMPAEFKAGDMALIADVVTTIPLDFSVDVELLDAEGNPVQAQLVLADGADRVRGSEDGVTEANSTLRMEFKLGGDGDIDQLFDIGSIHLKLEAMGASDNAVKINANQYIFATLKLELTGGITVDLESLLSEDGVEE